ncbi:MAG: cysteine--tRNA ligase [Candidatus Diapherotrites archaeon]|nr:cysteine--tRNA ligase [Candidatus Diapherotrites archaeon]
MKFFNTLGREKQEFKPLRDGEVTLYACGPTVYALPHIGNFRSFFFADTLHRYLEYKGYKVKFAMNITDIDDKTIRDSKEAGVSLKEFTDKYTKVFFEGLDALNIKRADFYPKATENIPEMIDLVQHLLDKELAYIVNGSVYYSIHKFPDYGKLSGMDLGQLEHGHRVDVDEYEKDAPGDFAVWKAASAEEIERKIFFDTPWGKGRPGWHIECSAMSRKELGQPFDIHTGGVDLIFPHHENEIAQSEGAYGEKFVNYWLHGEHLSVDGRKMSKSKGNYFTLTDLLEKYSYNEIRYLFLSTHYRDKLNYTEPAMKNAASGAAKLELALQNLDFFIANAKEGKEDKEFLATVEKRKTEFNEAMDDDLDTPRALRAIHELVSDIYRYEAKEKKALEKAKESLRTLLHVFGLFEKEGEREALGEALMAKIKEREAARAAKDFEKADSIRDELKKKGVLLDDFPEGTRWRRA